MAHNNAPHEGLPNQLSPREVHFTRAPRSFLRAIPEVDSNAPPSIRSTIAAARAVREDVVRNDVMAHVKRQEKRSPTNYTARIQKGDYALQKRTSFPTSVPKKLAFRTLIDAYEVKARIATNSYRVTSLLTGENHVVAGDLLIKVRGLTRDDLIELCAEMERISARNASRSGARVTRAAAREAEEGANVASISQPELRQTFSHTHQNAREREQVFSLSMIFESLL